MYNLVYLRGLNAAGVATEITRACSTVAGNAVTRQLILGRSVLLFRSRQYTSKAPATVNEVSDQSEDRTDDAKKVSVTKNSVTGIKPTDKVKVLLIEKSLALKSLASNEAPAVHHAQAGAIVHVGDDDAAQSVRSNLKQKEIEVRLRVDQLLKDAKSSVQSASDIQPYEDAEYVEESKDRKKEKTQLVGALNPNALDWKSQKILMENLASYYASLSKSRLTGLVVLTAVAGYAMAPAPLEPLALVLCSVGTGLTSSAANTINQFLEVPYDSQMDRTRNRILVTGMVSPLHAVCFAAVCSTMGLGMLYYGVNGFAASLAALNLVLYSSIYTPMKRMNVANTWVGSLVGAIPPLIGWVGCSGELETGALIMAAILYSWQFPHFNALSWNLRSDYSRAGYRMMSVTNPGLCKRVALRHSVGMIGICSLAPVVGVTTWTFAVDSLPFNGYLVYLAWRFYRDGDSKSSRKLFMFSLLHLPAIMMLMIISKKHYKKKVVDAAENTPISSEQFVHSENQISIGTVR